MIDVKKNISQEEVESAKRGVELSELAKDEASKAEPNTLNSDALNKFVKEVAPYADEDKDTLNSVVDGSVQVVEQKENKPVATSPRSVSASSDIKKIDSFIEVRQAFIKKVNAICVEGKDYHVIQGKKSLAKGGAEKIASIFQWNAQFKRDEESLEMLGKIEGLVAFRCELYKGDKYVGEGRGAALLSKNAGDPNKTLKMAQKSAFIDAVLRTSGLSDFFTQDLEDMPKDQIGGTTVQENKKPTEKQAELIKKLCKQKNVSQEELAEIVKTYKTPHDLIDYLIKERQ